MLCYSQVPILPLFGLSVRIMSVADRSAQWRGLRGVHQHRTRGECCETRWGQWLMGQYDGSDSGARPDEAISWGKIKAGAESVKVNPLPLPESCMV